MAREGRWGFGVGQGRRWFGGAAGAEGRVCAVWGIREREDEGGASGTRVSWVPVVTTGTAIGWPPPAWQGARAPLTLIQAQPSQTQTPRLPLLPPHSC